MSAVMESVFCVALFSSISHVLRAEKLLQKEGITVKLIPVPKEISTDCGICLRFTPEIAERVRQTLAGNVEVLDIRCLG